MVLSVADDQIHPPGPLQWRGVARNKSAVPVGVQYLVRRLILAHRFDDVGEILRLMPRAIAPKPRVLAMSNWGQLNRSCAAAYSSKPVKFLIERSPSIIIWQSGDMVAQRRGGTSGSVLRETGRFTYFGNA